jgi:hypothetical protein
VQNLAFPYQLLDRPGDVLDRDLRVDSVLVKEIDAIGPEALEHAFDSQLDVRRAAVEPRAALTRLEIDVPAELRCDRDLVSERRDALAEDPLDLMRTVRLRGVKEVTPRSKAVRMMLIMSGRLGIVV